MPKSQQNYSDESGDFLLILIATVFLGAFVFASPGLVVLSVMNVLLENTIAREWAGSQIFVTAAILSLVLYIPLYSLDLKIGGMLLRMTTYIGSAAWFPFSYYGLKIHYFTNFISCIDWYYCINHILFVIILILSVMFFGFGMLSAGLLFLTAPFDPARAWSWAIAIELVLPLLYSLIFCRIGKWSCFTNVLLVTNIIAGMVLCIARYEFLAEWPYTVVLQFFEKSLTSGIGIG